MIRAGFFLTVAIAFSICLADIRCGDGWKIFHVFFFNLVSGGLVITCIHVGRKAGPRVILYFILTILLVFFLRFGEYLWAFSVIPGLVFITESIRWNKYPVFPVDFFRWKSSVAEKFSHAALLCLSLSHILMGAVILNNYFFHWWFLPKLNIQIFYLGYSFPVSLTIISYMIRHIPGMGRWMNFAKDGVFWMLNLGVITLFLGIITESFLLEIIVSVVLFLGVLILGTIYFLQFPGGGPKTMITSGLFFLITTASSGIAYAVVSGRPEYEPAGKYLLKLHAIYSLFGWNLSGLLVVVANRLPQNKISIIPLVVLHWVSLTLVIAGLFSYPIYMAGVVVFTIFLFWGIYKMGPETTPMSSQ